jgi:hypothetical protein
MILHLPTLGGLAAAQAQSAEELDRLSRQAEARNLHRDVVEVVAALKEGVALVPTHPDSERRRPAVRRLRRRGPLQEEPEPLSLTIEPVVDLRV